MRSLKCDDYYTYIRLYTTIFRRGTNFWRRRSSQKSCLDIYENKSNNYYSLEFWDIKGAENNYNIDNTF